MSDQPSVPYGLCHCGCGQKTAIPDKSCASRGIVKGEPKRFVHGHNARRTPHDYAEEDHGYETPCWIWQRSLGRGGYGMGRFGGKTGLAHRGYYVAAKGPIPPGLQLDHLCRVRACVNPDHLEAVTGSENTRRGANAKIGVDDVRAIRASTERPRFVAARYGLTSDHVGDIRAGRSWRDVD